jgi:hypothetical protein
VARTRFGQDGPSERYAHGTRRLVLFHGLRHPNTMGAPEIELFLTDLAVNGHVAATTQNQALNALVFLYQQVLSVALPRQQPGSYKAAGWRKTPGPACRSQRTLNPCA